MKKLLKAHEKKVRYLLAGAWNTLFGYVSFVALYRIGDFFKRHYLVALGISQFFGIANAYLSYKHFVFKTRGGYLREYFKFSAVYWVLFVINLFLLPFLVHAAHLSPILAQTLVLPVMVALSYIVHNRFSFKAKAPKK